MKKWGIHMMLWAGLYLFWVMVFQNRSFALAQTATIEFCYLLFIAGNFYFNVSFAIPRFLNKGRYFQYALLFVAGIAMAAMLRVPLAMFMNESFFRVGKSQPSAAALFLASFLNIAIWTTLVVAAKVALDRFRMQQYMEEIRKEKSKTELDFLNAQLNPHFLFNSIHSIYGSIDKNNQTARNMLLTFSDMLRYQLYDCSSEVIDLNSELQYIQSYITLQRARKEEDLIVDFRIDNNVRGLKVAPLLFICFIENAFKYVGVTAKGEHRVELSFYRKKDLLSFTCMNTKDPIPVVNLEHRGIGIDNARRRLKLHYPDSHVLDISQDEEHYFVNLKIKMDEVEMSDY
ncbi:MAG TPA: histidine kinase [Flavisolibacter sp.]|jgi:hypothetical protein|nr:histidine kinase [Flavisolibacter sp.]